MILTYDKLDFRLVQKIERQPCDTERRDISCLGFFCLQREGTSFDANYLFVKCKKTEKKKWETFYEKKTFFLLLKEVQNFFLGLCIINASEERERTLPERTLCIFLRKKEKSFEIRASK